MGSYLASFGMYAGTAFVLLFVGLFLFDLTSRNEKSKRWGKEIQRPHLLWVESFSDWLLSLGLRSHTLSPSWTW